MSVYRSFFLKYCVSRFINHSKCLSNSFSTRKSGKLNQLSDALTERQRNVLKKFNIEARYIDEYPSILYSRPDDLSRNIKLMRDIGLEEDAVVEMLAKDASLITKCYKTCKSDLRKNPQHRINYLSRELKVTQREFCSALPKYKFILSLSLARIKNVMNVLISYKVQPGDIFSDFWIIRCKAGTISERLQLVENAEVDCIRPWMARCKKETFQNFMSRVSTKQKLLGESSLEEYISKRLGYSVAEIKEIIDTEPQLQKTSVLKIKKILDFLFASGFSSDDIVAGLPRVANRNIDTIHARLQELSQLGIPPSLYVVCKSKREYQHYVGKRKNRSQ